MLALFSAVSLALAFLVALLILRQAARLGLVQAPNQRSSHTIPTPSGGGIGIAIGALAILPLIGADLRLLLAGACCGLLALLGLADDRLDLPALPRLIAQLLLVAVVIATAPWSAPLDPRLAAALIALLLAGVWWVNLFNFMDGIDGIAASQAILILAAATSIWMLQGTNPASPLLIWMIATAAAALGFLLLNWPPARIFMGDAGTNFLALTIFAMAAHTVAMGALRPEPWLILIAAFASDATITLLRRALRGERLMSAHRSHAYQILSRRWGGHRPVTLLYGAMTLFWAAPLAALAQFGLLYAPLAVAVAYLPVLAFCIIVGRTTA